MKNIQILFVLFLSFLSPLMAQGGASCQLELKQGWNAYALDFVPDESSMSVLRNVGEIVVWRNGHFIPLPIGGMLGIGEGFFLNTSDEVQEPIMLSGTTDASVELQKGWNLCSKQRVSEGVSFYSLDDINAAYVQQSEPENGRAVWIYAMTLNTDDVAVQIPCGSMVSRTASEKTGYTFTDWTVSGVTLPDITTQTISFAMPYRDVSLTSNYTVNNYTLTVNGEDEQIAYNTLVYKTAPDKEGHAFTNWTVVGASVYDKSAKTVIFLMPTNDVELISNYSVNSYTLTVDGISDQREYGNAVSVTANEKTGHTFKDWSADGVIVPEATANPLVFNMPANDVTLTANYTVNSYTLMVDGVQEQVLYGTAVSKTADVKEGHTFTGWTVTGVSVEDDTANQLFFTMPANDVTLTANYTINQYALSVDGTAEQVTYAAPVSKTAPAKTGYTFRDWTVEGVGIADSTANPIEFTMPANDVVLNYNYSVNEYALTVDGQTEQVTFEAEVSKAVPQKTGHSFTNWTVTGVSVADVTADPLVFSMPANDVTLTPNYMVNNYTLTVDVLEEQIPYGAEVTKIAPVKEGHSFTEWTITDVTVDDRTANPLVFNMPANDVTLTANYTVNSYTLTVDSAQEQVPYGTAVSKTADDKEGYTFTGWTVTGVTVADATANPLEFTMPANNVTLTSNYEVGGTYLVVYLEDNAQAGVKAGDSKYTNIAPDISDDTCRTSELWLRRISKGTFTMGSPTDEVGRYDNETQHQVTLTQDYYIGVFEMTQRQYELITGDRPSYFRNASYYATRPVENVSYDMVRGASFGDRWPANNCVDSTSFLGKLQAKTGLVFDLPTEAQWEHACRAGTTTSLNTGKNVVNAGWLDANLNAAGRNYHNGGVDYSPNCDTSKGAAKVGSYLPNAWGLYDMHGNVGEWCLDWAGDYSGDATDPVGASSGSRRVVRGGNFRESYLACCRSAYRGSLIPSVGSLSFGFRVVCLVSETSERMKLTVNGEETYLSQGATITITALKKSASTFTGWTVEGMSVADPTAIQLEFSMPANDVTLTANYEEAGEGTYLVVYLEDNAQAGVKAGVYEYTDAIPDLSDDACRTSELWLRRIPKNAFLMGSPKWEVGRYDKETLHKVTLTQDYYIGVFEMTQRQYELITGSKPSYFKNASCYATRPVEMVSYDMIRGSSLGAGWPTNNNVDSTSFLGKLRAKTGLTFDLPTEAQWEYACRAGTTTSLNSGKNMVVNTSSSDANLNEVGRNYYNRDGEWSQTCDTSNGTAKVGSYLPNAWGLYDMHGNVAEWCLDRCEDYSGDAAIDPVGASSGSLRVLRGGSWDDASSYASCRSARRFCTQPSYNLDSWGFRVVCPCDSDDYYTLWLNGENHTKKAGETVSFTAEDKEGMTFVGWDVEGIVLDSYAPQKLEFTMPLNTVSLTAKYVDTDSLYMVVNLESGETRYSSVEPALSDDTCRTTELWLRRIPAGTFPMGRLKDENLHQVTLTKDYYIGVFEMTQRQYELITGDKPSYFNNATYYSTRPVEKVSYNMIRGSSLGAGWPSNNDVDNDSFLGKLRSKTCLLFDLPTEAQWEYACRAGTTTSLNSGKNMVNFESSDANLNEVGRNWYNGGSSYSQSCDTSAGTAKVGSYLPNVWGLYDMHGNVSEWCLDWYSDYSGDATDPAGASSGSNRVERGGSYTYGLWFCPSTYRNCCGPSGNFNNGYYGFRVAFIPVQ